MTVGTPHITESAFVPALFTVTGRQKETHDTVTLNIQPQASGLGKIALPGQFNMLYVHGIGEIPISLSGIDPSGAAQHTVRSVGQVSSALCSLKSGDCIAVRGPYGTSWPLDDLRGRNLLIIAGGLGLAPLRPAIQHVLHLRHAYGDVGIYVGARTPKDVLFAKELRKWRQRYSGSGASAQPIEIRITVDRESGKPGMWGEEVGIVTALLPKLLINPERTAAMICGPEVMMRHVVQDLLKLGLSSKSIYLSLERNMKCAIGLCGHCQFNRHFICRDGPVFSLAVVEQLLTVKEL